MALDAAIRLVLAALPLQIAPSLRPNRELQSGGNALHGASLARRKGTKRKRGLTDAVALSASTTLAPRKNEAAIPASSSLLSRSALASSSSLAEASSDPVGRNDTYAPASQGHALDMARTLLTFSSYRHFMATNEALRRASSSSLARPGDPWASASPSLSAGSKTSSRQHLGCRRPQPRWWRGHRPWSHRCPRRRRRHRRQQHRRGGRPPRRLPRLKIPQWCAELGPAAPASLSFCCVRFRCCCCCCCWAPRSRAGDRWRAMRRATCGWVEHPRTTEQLT